MPATDADSGATPDSPLIDHWAAMARRMQNHWDVRVRS